MTRYIILLLLLFIAACSPVNKYKDQADVKAWEPAIEKFDSLDKTEHYANDAILFAGSSSTGYGHRLLSIWPLTVLYSVVMEEPSSGMICFI
jgi:hypothetical protein